MASPTGLSRQSHRTSQRALRCHPSAVILATWTLPTTTLRRPTVVALEAAVKQRWPADPARFATGVPIEVQAGSSQPPRQRRLISHGVAARMGCQRTSRTPRGRT